LVENYEKAIGRAMEEINKAQTQGRDVSKALEAVETATKKHTEVLMDLLRKVPEQAKSAITHAIEVSKRGRNRALEVLNKIQRGELPIGKPEGVGKPEDVSRSEGKGIGKPERIGKPEGVGRPPGTPGGGPGGGRGQGR
jgi:predicted RNase H-like HicB family nuclease